MLVRRKALPICGRGRMRRTRRGIHRPTILYLVLACALAVVAGASASSTSVQGAVFTSVNPSIDGTGHCLNGPGPINCNIYTGKRFVWLNGGPAANKLRPAGKYF